MKPGKLTIKYEERGLCGDCVVYYAQVHIPPFFIGLYVLVDGELTAQIVMDELVHRSKMYNEDFQVFMDSFKESLTTRGYKVEDWTIEDWKKTHKEAEDAHTFLRLAKRSIHALSDKAILDKLKSGVEH